MRGNHSWSLGSICNDCHCCYHHIIISILVLVIIITVGFIIAITVIMTTILPLSLTVLSLFQFWHYQRYYIESDNYSQEWTQQAPPIRSQTTAHYEPFKVLLLHLCLFSPLHKPMQIKIIARKCDLASIAILTDKLPTRQYLGRFFFYHLLIIFEVMNSSSRKGRQI